MCKNAYIQRAFGALPLLLQARSAINAAGHSE